MEIVCPPPKIPGLNLLDLDYFNSIQSLQNLAAPSSTTGLVSAVNSSFDPLECSKLNDVFLTLQTVMGVLPYAG